MVSKVFGRLMDGKNGRFSFAFYGAIQIQQAEQVIWFCLLHILLCNLLLVTI